MIAICNIEGIIFFITDITEHSMNRKIICEMIICPAYCERFRLKIDGLLAYAADTYVEGNRIGKLRSIAILVFLYNSPQMYLA